ncbi:cytochrome-c peroxidase [Hymenobacter sp. BT175]|uniref:cytochrome-c peroxidase n=1 Tax=Hymenobacter translucens TaxID=2886507 RepID=UPI001D0ECBFB|nr:cytochrome c peroxidase [Hymenobacter translucens]MCC2548657.1 cytochrome-c peroxidase [Hymenobacter translucens]
MALNLTRLRALLLLPAGMLLLSCCTDPLEEEPVVTTPYQLTIPSNFPQNARIPADNPLTEEGVALGRMLFYEPRLSRDNTLSCGSCHQQSKAFTDGRALAIGVNGARHTRSSMSLVNLAWEPVLNWDGAATTLETQARLPLENPVEMHQLLGEGVRKLQQTDLYPPLFRKAFGSTTITEQNVLKALAQFQRTLISSNSRYDRSLRRELRLTVDEQRGEALYNNHPNPDLSIAGADCMHCHGGPLFTSQSFHNNGLDATFTDPGRKGVTGLAVDNGKFRAPTLRNIELTAPYMHDGRFATLEDVLDHYSDHVKRSSPNIDPLLLDASNTLNGTQLDLTQTQKNQIIAFLRTLTDTTFTRDKRFSDPFKP